MPDNNHVAIMKKKNLFFLLCANFLLIGSLSAKTSQFRLYTAAGGGIHSFLYSVEGGYRENSLGYFVSAGYSKPLNKQWELGIAVQIGSANSLCTLNSVDEENRIDHGNGDIPYIYRIYYTQLKEKQNITYLSVPISFSYKFDLKKKWQLYVSSSINGFFPISSNFKRTAGLIESRGYYPDLGIEFQRIPQHGFFVDGSRQKGNWSCERGLSFGLDLGFSKQIKPDKHVFAGIHFNHSMSNTLKTADNKLVDDQLAYNGLLNSNKIESVVPFCAGLKIGYASDFTKEWEIGEYLAHKSNVLKIKHMKKASEKQYKKKMNAVRKLRSHNSRRMKTSYKPYRNERTRIYTKNRKKVRSESATRTDNTKLGNSIDYQNDTIRITYDLSADRIIFSKAARETLKSKIKTINDNSDFQLIVIINSDIAKTGLIKAQMVQFGILENRIKIYENNQTEIRKIFVPQRKYLVVFVECK